MTRDQLLERVRAAALSVLNLTGEAQAPEITLETEFAADLNFDSLDTIELVIGLEDAFEIEVPDADVEELKTVGDAVDYLAKVLGVPAE